MNTATAAILSNGRQALRIISAYANANRLSRVNKKGKFVYIKYHFVAEHGQKQLTQPEAIRISGEDPDYSKRQP